MIEDVIVTLDSWECLVDFVSLSPKETLGGYPIILGRPWLAIVNACISFHSGKMTISNGSNIKNLSLCSPATPLLQDDQVVCPNLGDDEPNKNLLS